MISWAFLDVFSRVDGIVHFLIKLHMIRAGSAFCLFHCSPKPSQVSVSPDLVDITEIHL